MLIICIVNVNVPEMKSTGLWLESSRKNWALSSCVLFIFLYKTFLASYITPYPGGALRLKLNKICPRIPLTIEPST